jgi:hypothetical protein
VFRWQERLTRTRLVALATLRGLQIALDIDFRRLKTQHGDYSERQLEEVLLATD